MSDRALNRILWWVLISFGVAIAALFLAAGIAITAGVSGNHRFEYRCTSGVMEYRDVYWGVGVGTFNPIDGDPVGACPESV